MERFEYTKLLDEALQQIPKGAFLMTNQDHNPMTIGWCEFGAVWGKPVCTVMVRQTRFTHTLIEKGDTFSVCVPAFDTMKQELAFCGTNTGRGIDKCAAAGLEWQKALAGGADTVKGCAIHFECRIVFKAESDLKNMDAAILKRYYNPANQKTVDGDPHTIYFGEILAAYRE